MFRSNTKKIFNDSYPLCEMSNYEIFKDWATKNKIKSFIRGATWQKVTIPSGYRNKHYSTYEQIPGFLGDHMSLWRHYYGGKILICQPYEFEPYKEKFNALKKWCNFRNLIVNIYDSSYSWYYPGKTVLIEIYSKYADIIF